MSDQDQGDEAKKAYSELGKYRASKRQRVTKTCEICNKVLPDSLTRRRYCSPACKLKGYRNEQRQKRSLASDEHQETQPNAEGGIEGMTNKKEQD